MQRTTLALLVAVVAIAAVGGVAAADAESAQDDMITVELYVTTPDGEAVGNADATIEWDGGSVETTTRSNGRVFEDVPQGADLEISLEHDQYVKNVPQSFESVENEQLLELTMHPSATASVEVVDADGNAVEDARVRLKKTGQSTDAASGRTDADGSYTSPEIEEGSYTLRAVKQGHYEHSSTETIEGEFSRSVEIEQGTVTIDLLVQDPTPEGSGTLDADVTFEHDGNQYASVRTNDAGERSVALEVNTRYDVTAEREGYKRVRDAFTTDEESEEYVINMTRTPAITLAAENDRVVVGENLRVEVTDEYDRPVEGATVYVNDEASGETDADGVARVEIPEEGAVSVHAEVDDLSSEPVEVEGISEAEAEDEDPGGAGDSQTPGFGVVGALVAAVLATAALARRR